MELDIILENGAEARRLRRLAREADALAVVKRVRRESLVPMNPAWERPTPEEEEARRIARLDDNLDHTVYFLYCAGHVKIGFTSLCFFSRNRDLANGTPIQTLHLFALSGGERTEYLLHKKFDAHRTIGEWFRFHQDIREFILEHGNEHDANAVRQAETDYRKWIESEAISLGIITREMP